MGEARSGVQAVRNGSEGSRGRARRRECDKHGCVCRGREERRASREWSTKRRRGTRRLRSSGWDGRVYGDAAGGFSGLILGSIGGSRPMSGRDTKRKRVLDPNEKYRRHVGGLHARGQIPAAARLAPSLPPSWPQHAPNKPLAAPHVAVVVTARTQSAPKPPSLAAGFVDQPQPRLLFSFLLLVLRQPLPLLLLLSSSALIASPPTLRL